MKFQIQPIMCNIYRGIPNTTYYVSRLSWNTKYKLLCVTFIVKSKYKLLCITFIVEFKIQPTMCNIYRGIQNTTYYV